MVDYYSIIDKINMYSFNIPIILLVIYIYIYILHDIHIYTQDREII